MATAPALEGLRTMAALHTLLFVALVVIVLEPRRPGEQWAFGMFVLFAVTLVTEVYLAPAGRQWLLGAAPDSVPLMGAGGYPLVRWLGLPPWSGLVGAGAGLLIGLGGIAIMYLARRQQLSGGGVLVTDGLYGRMRHPQYAGLSIVMIGMLGQWPAPLAAISVLAPAVGYWWLARAEERRWMTKGLLYRSYRRLVPGWIPSSRRPAVMAGGSGGR